MLSKVGVGMIGCGKQASKHIESLKRIPWTNLWLNDIDQGIVQEMAEKQNLKWVADTEELLASPDIRAVVISTPTEFHESLIKKAVNAGKDVFCEKPLTYSMDEAEELVKVIEESGRILMVGYVYRYTPIFEEGFELFRKQQINGESMVLGKPLTAFFRLGGRGDHQEWKHKKASQGGAINEMLVHMVDLANWYFGPLKDIDVLSNKTYLSRRSINGKTVEADAEDYVMIRCKGEHGVEIICQADLITPSFNQFIEVQCENGSYMGSIQQDFPSYIFLKEERGGYGAGKNMLKYERRNFFDIQMMMFVQMVLEQAKPDRNTIYDSIELMSIMNDIRYKTEKGNFS